MEALTKVDVARRQLAEVIRLFFFGRDPVAVHTLASAAQAVLRDVAKQRKLEHLSILHDNPLVPESKRKTWFSALNSARNYFKHADNDAETAFLFNPEQNESVILDGVLLHMTVTGQSFQEGNVFLGWFTTKHPALRHAISNNVVGDFCVRNKIDTADLARFVEMLDSRILVDEISNKAMQATCEDARA